MAWSGQRCWPLDEVLPPLSAEGDPLFQEFRFLVGDSLNYIFIWSLPSCQGFSYLLTMIDMTSRWPEAVLLSSIKSEACTRAFTSTWVSRFGVPALLTSDQGAQFRSSVWSEVCSILQISRIKTTSFHTSTNGMIERFHHSLKSSLRGR